MRLATLQVEAKLQKCNQFGEVYRRIYVRKSRFTATRRRKTKFPTVYPTVNLPNTLIPKRFIDFIAWRNLTPRRDVM